MAKLRHKCQKDAWPEGTHYHPNEEMQYHHEPCAILLQRVTGTQTVPVVKDKDSGHESLKWNRVKVVDKYYQRRASHYDWSVREAIILAIDKDKFFAQVGREYFTEEELIRYILSRHISSEEHYSQGYQMWIDYLVKDGFLEPVGYKLTDKARDNTGMCTHDCSHKETYLDG